MMLACQSVVAQTGEFLLVGTYTSGKSEGIYVYRFDQSSGETARISAVKTPNPSYLAVSPDQRFVYAVAENADSTSSGVGGQVAAFSFDREKGSLKEINRQFSYGKHPCYISVDQTGKMGLYCQLQQWLCCVVPGKG
jgi:6-phosphogluconolactonase